MDDFLKVIMDNDVIESRLDKDNKLVEKWGKYGFLKGITDENKKRTIARLFENQKNQMKRQIVLEQTSMAGGDVQGFAAVSMPIIRRVFGNLIGASELVSVQSLDQPVGLIFVLDFTAGTNKGGMGLAQNASIYGQGRVGIQILSGADLSGANVEAGFGSLNQGYTQPSGTVTLTAAQAFGSFLSSGTVGGTDNTLDRWVRFDPDLSGSFVAVLTASKALFPQLNEKSYMAIADGATTSGTLVKRLTQEYAPDPTKVVLIYSGASIGALNELSNTAKLRTYKYPIYDNFAPASALSSIVGTTPWGFEFDGSTGQNAEIPEIDLKVEAFNIQTNTRMLKAKWTAQVSQDLAAWQNMDAEVELTSVLSEQVAMEIDMEVLKDLVEGGKATVRYWSRRPGRFVIRTTGEVIPAAITGDFTGNVAEWYQTLLENINDISAQIARKVLRGGATFLVTSPEVQSILESTNQWYAATTVGESEKGGQAGLKKEGSVSKKWDVLVSPYFLRNVILVGRKGSSNLETGYVYAPYVPLITSPTIPNPDNLFVYNKGVMTRYGKKMIRPDMYALCIVLNLEG